MGRPTEYSSSILPLVKCAATFGATAEEIAAYLKVNYRTFYGWMMLRPELAAALNRGREQSDARVENSLYHQALKGNVTACIFWLKNRKPSEWRDVQNITGDIGHYILSNRPMTEDEWIEAKTKLIDADVAPTLPQTEDQGS